MEQITEEDVWSKEDLERLKNFVAVPTILYMDKAQYTQCTGRCKPQEIKGEGYWNIVLCVFCHYEEFLERSCLGVTQYGSRCRRTNTNKDGYCVDHKGRQNKSPLSEPFTYEQYLEFQETGRWTPTELFNRDEDD